LRLQREQAQRTQTGYEDEESATGDVLIPPVGAPDLDEP